MYTITLTKDDVNETLKEIGLLNFPGLWNASKVWAMSLKKNGARQVDFSSRGEVGNNVNALASLG